jgi:DNA-binding LacI/PurR family transcriptional regulator
MQDDRDDRDDGGIAPPTRVRTLVDLAKLAGVTAGTASRALAGKDVVNAHTRARIQALAAEHGFRLNRMAQRLRTRRTGMIGVVVPLGHERRQHLSDPFFMTLLGHLADTLTENGYDLMLSRVIPDDPEWLHQIVDSGMLDGVLLIGQSDQFDAIEQVAARYRPLVVWGTSLSGQVHCAVGVDNREGGRLAGERLIGRGCRAIAFMGDVRALELQQRYAGLCDAAQAAGIDPPLQFDTHLALDIMADEIASHLDGAGRAVDGIAAASDLIAMRTVRALADRGRRVPDDVAVTGFDDLPFAQSMVPRITTVRQDLVAGAALMVQALFERIGGKDAPSIVMQPVLVERDTA